MRDHLRMFFPLTTVRADPDCKAEEEHAMAAFLKFRREA